TQRFPLSSPSEHRFSFFRGPATSALFPLPLHDALPISLHSHLTRLSKYNSQVIGYRFAQPNLHTECLPQLSIAGVSPPPPPGRRSEEHTSELQSREKLVCRLLLGKKKTTSNYSTSVPTS